MNYPPNGAILLPAGRGSGSTAVTEGRAEPGFGPLLRERQDFARRCQESGRQLYRLGWP